MSTLKRVFGFDRLRPGQEAVISAVLACLAVNPDYRHGGRGDELLKRIEARARAQGIKTLFVLTTRTAHWFRERGFEPSSVERMPTARASLYNYQRNSKVFEKTL
ncbi:GNAT family N-acetyltransferase [Pseudomonas sp. NY15364]|uniref:GNAT family N-acetyltransferase n=1 Tax=Pseudomonas sp. NY15364 TaxID=3400353 RepID=UPI003A8543B5